VDVVGKITLAILEGLNYLYKNHRIMHRDIQPSNVIINSRGIIKLFNFGVSSELMNSIAETFVGSIGYMAPERIQGAPYTIKSDVWAVGLTMIETATSFFPFFAQYSNNEERCPLSTSELLQQIVNKPSPKLPKSEVFMPLCHEFVEKCLMKDPKDRPSPQELLVSCWILCKEIFWGVNLAKGYG
jgi:mitogen-activated protein kinase kinase